MYVKNVEIMYLDSFGVENLPKEIKTFIGNKNIKTKIFRIQANNSIVCGYFCIGLTNFFLAGKTLIDYTFCFRLMVLKKMMIWFWVISKMNGSIFIEVTNTSSNLNDQTKFRLNEVNKIKDYFNL